MKLLLHPIVISFAIIIAAIISFMVIFNWQISDLNSQTAQAVAQRNDLQKKITLLSSLGQLKSDSALAVQDQQKLDAMLPTSDQLLDFPNWLDGLSRVSNVNMTFSFQGNQIPASASAPGSINFTLSLSGKLDDVVNFVKAIEITLPRYMVNITQINLSQAGSGVQVNINGQLFSR